MWGRKWKLNCAKKDFLQWTRFSPNKSQDCLSVKCILHYDFPGFLEALQSVHSREGSTFVPHPLLNTPQWPSNSIDIDCFPGSPLTRCFIHQANKCPLTYWLFHISCLLARTSFPINVSFYPCVHLWCTRYATLNLNYIFSCLILVAAVSNPSLNDLEPWFCWPCFRRNMKFCQVPIQVLFYFTTAFFQVFIPLVHIWQWMTLTLRVLNNPFCFFCLFSAKFCSPPEMELLDSGGQLQGCLR